MWNENWKKGEDYPAWGNNDVYKKTISGGYLFHDESPREAYMRVAKTVARRLYKPEMADTFFEYIWNGWLCLASPVLSNTGTDRVKSDPPAQQLQVMEHQTGLSPFAKYTTQQFLQLIKDQSEGELPVLISTLTTRTSRSGWKSENLKAMLTDNRLTYISAQLLVISLCVSLNKEMRMLEIDGVNYLESERQLENRILCLKEMLTKTIQKHTKKTD